MATTKTTDPVVETQPLDLAAAQARLAQLRSEQKALREQVKAARATKGGTLESIIAKQDALLPIWERREISKPVWRRVAASQPLEEAISAVLAQFADAAKEDVENKLAGRPSVGLAQLADVTPAE